MKNKDLVIIVGAGPGVSGAVATAFAEMGHPIMLIARNAERLEAIAAPLREHGATVTVHSGDASVPGDIEPPLATVTDWAILPDPPRNAPDSTTTDELAIVPLTRRLPAATVVWPV
jgi:NAD(P)-dependent dehydrogenase (short-subunit alcohol dehydrogenase family)